MTVFLIVAQNGFRDEEYFKPKAVLEEAGYQVKTGSTDYFTDKTALKLAAGAYQKNKVVGAICIAPGILARSGILKGKRATVFPGEIETLKREGAVYVALPVVVDGRIVMADGPEAAEEFGKTLVKIPGL
ncbi:MAG: DJ-1/PfpI family protein [Candidatus Omnitrophota bacterium]